MSPIAALLLSLAAQEPATLLVLPPETSREQVEAARLAEAVSDLLPPALMFLGTPAIDRADRLLALQALEIPPVAVTRATSIRIAEALQAQRVVLGRLDLKGDAVELSLRLLDTERGTLSTPFVASGTVGSLGELLDGLAWDIALAAGTRISKSRAELVARRRAPPAEALRAYAAGLSAADASSRARQLKRALQLFPGFDEARLELGRLQLVTRESKGAYDTLGAVQQAPLARTARFLQGRCLLELGRYREAALLYAGLVASEPSAATLNNHALALLRQTGAELRASDVLRKALELRPGDPDLAFNLGFALLAEGDPGAAAFFLQGVVRGSARDTHARVVLAWALRRAGRTEEADEAWRAVAGLAPTYESLAKEDLSRRFERVLAGEHRVITSDAARSHAELAAAHLRRAEKALASGDGELVERELRMAAVSDPYDARVHLQLARAVKQRDTETAISELRVSLWCRDDAVVRVELAQLLKGLGRDAEARAEAALALRADPTNDAARKLAEGR